MRLLLACALASLAVGASAAQASGHQRLGVEYEPRNQVEAGFGLSWRPAASGMLCGIEASLEYSWRKAASVRAAISGEAAIRAAPGASSWNWGDPSVEIGRAWKLGSFRVGAGLGYSYPAPGAEAGYQAIEPSLSLASIRDPVVLSARLDARFRLPREAEGYLLWQPLSCSLSLSAWELLNDRIGYRFSVAPGLSLGTLRLGTGDTIVPAWSLGLSLSLTWDSRAAGARMGWRWSCGSSAEAEPAALEAGGSLRKEWL